MRKASCSHTSCANLNRHCAITSADPWRCMGLSPCAATIQSPPRVTCACRMWQSINVCGKKSGVRRRAVALQTETTSLACHGPGFGVVQGGVDGGGFVVGDDLDLVGALG